MIRRFFERAGVALAAAMLLLSGLARAQESAPPVSLDALDREIATRIDAAATPGAVVVVVENGAVVLSKGYGFADREAGAPMTTQTLVAAGSLSKNLTSLGVLALVEQGRLSLKDPLSARAPAVEIDNPWEAEHPILIEHVLEHTAGLEGST
ncbi:MAG: serine hydrolase domain-containing protein, partial [Pseudomonadota bacterium]